MVVYVVKHVPNNESTRRHPPFRHLEVQRERTSIWCRTWSKMTRSQSPLARDTRTNFLEKDGWHEIAGKFTRTKNHHAPSLSYKILYTKPIFNRNNKAFNIKVHTVIDRCRFIVTHWNKCVTLKLFISRKCNSWWWYFNKSQWRWLLQCIEFSQGSCFSAKQPSISASPRQCFERGQEPDAVWLCLSFPCEKKISSFHMLSHCATVTSRHFLLGMQKTWILNLGMNIIMN